MSKYDFDINLSDSSSTGKLIHKINKGSTILEFGCATGRMTKYLKEAMNCRLYIVEIEEDAYNTALKYAVDGVCCDAVSLEWEDKFKGVRFDSILFADVLEHLTDPELVLKRSAAFLKEGGYILISIPNITHNDVMIKAFYDRFDYTNVGLLDDTHIHFWGHDNIKELAEKTGLYLNKIEATYCPTCATEQHDNAFPKVTTDFLNMFTDRDYGEVYQFIITMSLTPPESPEEIEKITKRSTQKGQIYLDRGTGFSEQDSLLIPYKKPNNGRYSFHSVIQDTSDLIRVRFDPISQRDCILHRISMRQGGSKLLYELSDHIKTDDGVLMLGDDPKIISAVVPNGEPVIIEAEITLTGIDYVASLKNTCLSNQQVLAGYENEIRLSNEKIAELTGELAQLNSGASEVEGRNVKLSHTIEQLTAEKEIMRQKISSLNDQNASLHSANNDLQAERSKLTKEIESLNAQLIKKTEDVKALGIINEELEENSLCLKTENTTLLKRNNDLSNALTLLNTTIEELESDNKLISENYSSVSRSLSTAEKEINMLKSEQDKLKADISAYINLLNRKDLLLISKRNEIKNVINSKDKLLKTKQTETEALAKKAKAQKDQLDAIIVQQKKEIEKLTQQVEAYRNRHVIRISDKIWKVIWAIQRFFRKRKK